MHSSPTVYTDASLFNVLCGVKRFVVHSGGSAKAMIDRSMV